MMHGTMRLKVPLFSAILRLTEYELRSLSVHCPLQRWWSVKLCHSFPLRPGFEILKIFISTIPEVLVTLYSALPEYFQFIYYFKRA